MACGRAVVSTEVGGVCDLIVKLQASLDRFSVWEHGVTAPSGDVEAFTGGVRYLVERPELRRDMGAREALRARGSFKGRPIAGRRVDV